MKGIFSRFFDVFVKRSWWVIVFVVSCLSLYGQGVKRKMRNIYELEYRFSELQKDRTQKEQDKEDLSIRIHSHSDPAWIEMILMKELGVVPEGYMKVHFVKSENL